MIKNLSLILSIGTLLGCNTIDDINPEPDAHYYRVGKTHRSVGPFLGNNMIMLDDPSGKSTQVNIYTSDPDLSITRATSHITEVASFVTNSLSSLGQNKCPNDSLLNVYFVTKDTINDPEKMLFLTDPDITNHKTFLGLTTVIYPFPIASSFICSNCEEIGQEELIAHELAHAWLSLCGDTEFAYSEEIPELLEAEYSQR